MLVQVRRDDALRLDVDEVLASVALDAQGQVRVRVNVPEGFPEDGGGPRVRAEGGVAGALGGGRRGGGQRGRDVSVEEDVAVGGGG